MNTNNNSMLPPPPSLSKDDSVLGMNRTERLRRQHQQMQRPNMPVTPTLPKTSHFQTSSSSHLENRNPQQLTPQIQVSQVHNTQQGTSFTIELDTAVPKKTLPPHLAERLSKRTSVPKTVKDSEMGGMEDQQNTAMQTTTSAPTTTRKSMSAVTTSNVSSTANSSKSTNIIEFQKRKSLGLRQTSLFNKANASLSASNGAMTTNQQGSTTLTYTTFDMPSTASATANHGLTLDDDLEIGFESNSNGSPLLAMPNAMTQQPTSVASTQHGSFGMMAPLSQQQVNPSCQFSQTNMNACVTQPSQMNFGFSSQHEPQQQFGGFSFTQSQPVAPSQQASFTFGQQQQQEQPQQQTFSANSMNESVNLGNSQSQQQQQEQEKLKQQLAMEQQRLCEQQQQQQLMDQQQMWQQAQEPSQQQQQQNPQLYPSVSPPNFSPLVMSGQLSEESQRLYYEMQMQRAEMERERQAHMEMILRERAEIEMTREVLHRQQMELQAKMQEMEQLKQGSTQKNGRTMSPDDDERKKEVESRRNEKRHIQRTEILKSKRELNLLNVDKLSRASREKQRAEREEEKKRVKSFLPANIFSPPKHKPSFDILNKRASMYSAGTSMRSPPSSSSTRAIASRESIARISQPSSNRMSSSGPYLGHGLTNRLETPQSATSSVRSFASKSSSIRSTEASPGISKRKQVVLEKTRRKAEEFTRKKLSHRHNDNTPCQH
ncbi:hypothetical protein C9374_003675 [Naegleria lovaniensis]|uniref:Uncharacterized protein n=1 Tax=Naegleria lovaniensis TaxID=51637 RepID=A0AA88H7U6_NAELO|nr:uncharacterized protein C9374_003675 [Naegleria lovaniensis]KAG2393911.1 hypothetical protein C9374_003675 [Naegleria lovaniensis]